MPKRVTIGVPWFHRWHYDQIRQLLGEPSELPASFVLWEIEARRQFQSMVSDDIAPEAVIVTPDDLRFFCELRGVAPTLRTCELIAVLDFASVPALAKEAGMGVH